MNLFDILTFIVLPILAVVAICIIVVSEKSSFSVSDEVITRARKYHASINSSLSYKSMNEGEMPKKEDMLSNTDHIVCSLFKT